MNEPLTKKDSIEFRASRVLIVARRYRAEPQCYRWLNEPADVLTFAICF